jgi:hypothetical protein
MTNSINGAWMLATSFTALASLFLLAYIAYKVRKIHVQQFAIEESSQLAARESWFTYREVESLQALHMLLAPPLPFPPMRGYAGSPDFLLALVRHCLQFKPVIAIECSSGTSTLVIARCMQLQGQGHVYSLEHEPQYAEATRRLLDQHGLSQYATIVDAPLVDRPGQGSGRWYSLAALPELARSAGILVVDGPPGPGGKMARYPALPALVDRLAPACAIFVDDSNREDETRMVELWKREFPDFSATSLDCEKGCVVLRRGK